MLEDRLRGVVGRAHLLVDPGLRAPYERDWTGRWGVPARLVARPGSPEEVVEVVRACAADGAAVVPQGGNTGLVGGGVPRDGGQVVVSLRRLGRLDVDADAGELVAGAGITLGAAQDAARAVGWDVGVDIAARESATLGGMVATNAGGIRVLRHGPMRAQLIAVEAVLADGSAVGGVPGLAKDNTGYHWPSLLAGSEGTLGLVTQVHLRLVPLLAGRAVAVVGLASFAEAVRVCGAVRLALPSLSAAEVVEDAGVELVVRHRGAVRPFAPAPPVCLLLEASALDDPTEELGAALAAAGIDDAALATDAEGRRRLWQLREGHTEAIAAEAAARGGPVVKLDVTLPAARLADYAARAGGAVPGSDVVLFGHLADGNLHTNVLPPLGGWAAGGPEAVEAAVLDLVLSLGGSISSEHGVGVAKRPWLERQRGAADLAAMRAVKRALDPAGLLNPGVLL